MLVLYALAVYWIDADQSQVCSRLQNGWFSERSEKKKKQYQSVLQL